jgi:hypothetical protein
MHTMASSDKGNEELMLRMKVDGSKREYEFSAKGRLAVVLMAALLTFSCAGYLWATTQESTVRSQLPQKHSLPALKYRFYDTLN